MADTEEMPTSVEICARCKDEFQTDPHERAIGSPDAKLLLYIVEPVKDAVQLSMMDICGECRKSLDYWWRIANRKAK